MNTALDAIVIGAGANGLVAAVALARAGRRVLVLERGETLAGQAREIEFAPGFRASPLGLDAGWLPPMVAQALALTSPLPIHSGIPLTVWLADGGLLALPRDSAAAAAEIRRHSQSDAVRWPTFIQQMQKLASFLAEIYQLPAPDIDTTSPREAWPLLGLARRFRNLGRADMLEFLRVMPMAVHDLAEDWFEAGPLRAAIAAVGVHDSRQGPRSGGTALNLLHQLVGTPPGALRGRGVWPGGPGAFTAALETLARQSGVTIRTNANVARILVQDYAATAVVLDTGEEISSPMILSSVDPAATLLRMVDPVWLDPEMLLALRNIRFRGCTSYVLYALDGLPEIPGSANPDETLRGVFSLTSDVRVLDRAADAAKYGMVSDNLHIEVTVPTFHWPSQAPAGKLVLVARAHYSPYRLRDGAKWDASRADAVTSATTAAIERAIPCFTSRVLQQSTLTPADLETTFGLTEGAATHGELALDQILFMRPLPGLSRYATPIDGLHLCGAGTHPGPGIAGGSGWLAAKTILDARGRNSR